MSTESDPVINAASAGASPVRRHRTPEVETEFHTGVDLEGQLRALTLAELRRVRGGGQSIMQRIVD
jgi:hypothetical protein